MLNIVTREMQVKPTVRYHCIPSKMTIIFFFKVKISVDEGNGEIGTFRLCCFGKQSGSS